MYNRKVCLYRKGTLSIIRDSMKLRLSILLTLCFILIGEAYAQQGYEISGDLITVSESCSIPVRNFAPSGVDIYGDKDKGGVTKSGKDLFSERTTELNNSPKGISFKKDEYGTATMSVDFSAIEDETEIKFYQAKNDSTNGWVPDVKTFQVKVKKSTIAEKNYENQSTNNPYKEQYTIQLEALDKKIDKNKADTVCLFIVLLIGLFICCLLNLKKQAKKFPYLKEVVDNKAEYNNVQIASHQATQIKGRREKSMTDADIKSIVEYITPTIKKLIEEQIRSLLPQYITPTNKIVESTSPIQGYTGSTVNKKEQTTDTDNVKYHQEDNSFSLEQTDRKIFRVYSKHGEYYYTIVDDSLTREQLAGMLQAFEGCITYQTTGGIAKRVEPVAEGKLRKDGNKFYVDANNKLVVKFV